MKISGMVFTRNTFDGGWPLFESIANALVICDEVVVMDLGSDDGTWENIWEMHHENPRIRPAKGNFSKIDAGVFATIPNEMLKMCKHDTIFYFQADEIWHENLLRMTEEALKRGLDDLSFWRVRFRHNCQHIRQLPQRVHRVIPRDNFKFVDDDMNTNRFNDAPLCSTFGGDWFLKWGENHETFKKYPRLLPSHEMIMDASMVGMFRDNVPIRKEMHQPFWRDSMDLPHWNEDGSETRISMPAWIKQEGANPEWTMTESPFNIPKIMEGLLGCTKYVLRDDVEKAILKDSTRELIYDK